MMKRDYMHSLIEGLKPLEVLDYYDGPKFYSCRDSAGQLYLAYWIDQNKLGTLWLYIKISHERYSALKKVNIAIAKVLAKPEDGGAFIVQSGKDRFDVTYIEADQIDLEWLPDVDDRLSLEDVSLPVRLDSATHLAPRVHRQVLDIAFEKLSNAYEMSANSLGRLLQALQNAVHALAYDSDSDIRKVPDEIKQKSELLVGHPARWVDFCREATIFDRSCASGAGGLPWPVRTRINYVR
jgi:hypothetical protein